MKGFFDIVSSLVTGRINTTKRANAVVIFKVATLAQFMIGSGD